MLISKNVETNINEKIQEIEIKYNIILSQEYKKFLIKYNGGGDTKDKF